MRKTRSPLTIRFFSILAALSFVFAPSANAQEKSPELKLYVLDCGVLLYNSLLRFGYKNGEVTPTTLSDACYLIDNPGKGTLIWDTGAIADNLWTADGVPPKKFYAEGIKPLSKQLAEIGYAPKDITYVAVSHAHWDHLANLYQFAGSTWLTAPNTREQLFAVPTPRQTEPEMFTAVKNTRTVALPDDKAYDVFGDGKVIMIPAPGHTPDSKVLQVNLKQSGPVFLVGDLYHFARDVQTKIVTRDENGEQLTASRNKIQALAKQVRGQVWIPHDLPSFSKLKKAPAFYD